MKKNQSLAWIFMVIAVSQLGFDWGSQTAEEKGMTKEAPSSQTSGKTAHLPFPQMMEALTQNMTLWPALAPEDKKKAVEATILIFQDRQNSAILRPADFYVAQINGGLNANVAMQNADILSLLKMMAVIENDFYNGQNKEVLAKEVLGEKMYENIRAKKKA